MVPNVEAAWNIIATIAVGSSAITITVWVRRTLFLAVVSIGTVCMVDGIALFGVAVVTTIEFNVPIRVCRVFKRLSYRSVPRICPRMNERWLIGLYL